MKNLLSRLDTACFVIGRSLLGLYFLLPGLMKIVRYTDTLSLMTNKGIPLADLLLPLTIIIQAWFGASLIVGKNLRISALVLFGLTLLINIYIHDFWNLSGQLGYERELQNFIKNIGIAAGLLVLASRQKN